MTQADFFSAEPNHTVLVIEDEEDLRELMREALEMRGYSVITAQEGGEALRMLENNGPPCVILLDLLMPGMNGWDFFEQVRQHPEFGSVPVIVHSSSSSRAPAGAARTLQKPLAFERLLSVIGEFCGP